MLQETRKQPCDVQPCDQRPAQQTICATNNLATNALRDDRGSVARPPVETIDDISNSQEWHALILALFVSMVAAVVSEKLYMQSVYCLMTRRSGRNTSGGFLDCDGLGDLGIFNFSLKV